MHGWVTCDSLTELWDEDLMENEPTGSFSPQMMTNLRPGLTAALGF